MTQFLLIRHGEAEAPEKMILGRRRGFPLSRLGRARTAELARWLASYAVEIIYSSPQDRTRETAELLADTWHVPIRIASELEEVNYGDWTGRRFDELKEIPAWQAFNTQRSLCRIPNGEHMREVQSRIAAFMEQRVAENPEQTLAMVTHADVIRAALFYFLGAALDLSLRLEIGPASVSIVRVDFRGAPSVLCVNQTS